MCSIPEHYTIYIAGPMTGLPACNYPAFLLAAKNLRALGYKVQCPAEDAPPGLSWEGYMRRSIAMLLQCRSIYMLPGWHRSKGARIEFEIAKSLRMDARFAEDARCAPAA